MPLPLIDAALRGMVLALALLLLAVLLRQRRQLDTPAATAAMLLCAGLAVQVLGSAPWSERSLGCAAQAPLIAVSVGNAVLFALFSSALFDDGFRWRPWHVVAWGLAALLGGVQCPVMLGLDERDALRQAARLSLRLLPVLCVAGATWAALRHWRADLVESRRRLRIGLVAAGAAYTLVQLAARLTTSHGQLTPGLALLDVLALLAVLVGWALSVLRLTPDLLQWASTPWAAAQEKSEPATLAAPAELAAPPAAVDEAMAQALQQAFAVDRAYRDPKLSVAALAARLAVPEYRLRRHIHQQLGFRNFNAYVNSFRLDDACRWLRDPAQHDTPVLTLALDAGFGSVGPFNRAFKAHTGLTPTEFRADALAKNANR